MQYLKSLNPAQKEAVQHKEGPLLVLAGPGSGKTRVLTYRIAYLIQKGIDPFQILALTFTNKAANEMKERIEGVVGTEARNVWMGTFHSIFAKILRIEAEKIGYPRDFTIYDTLDSRKLIKSIVKELDLSTDYYKPNLLQHRISLAKNNLMSPKDYQKNVELQAEDDASGRPRIGEIYETYTQRCFKAAVMDFDDLLFKMYVLLANYPKTLYKYQHQFKHILIDEFQDTNTTQYIIVKKLGDVFQNICVVGDDAQSIYGFRGANIQNILNFEQDYPDLRKVKLEQNYRSTGHIVKAANHLIDRNQLKLAKKIWTDNKDGSRIKVIKAHTDNDEGRLITNDIFETKMREHVNNRDFAILYRTNAQSRAFEEALRKRNIAYQVFGGLSFYQRKEVKDFLAYLRVLINPHDEEALKRIINYPPRGIGKTTLQKIIVWANEANTSLWNVIKNIEQYNLSSRAKNAVGKFVTMIKSLQSMLETNNAYEVAKETSKATGLLKKHYEDKTPEGINRYEHLEELLNSIKEFTESEDEDLDNNVEKLDKKAQQKQTSLASYLQQVSLLTDIDRADEETDAVSLMTVHSAKGLEFPFVYVVGLEENLFPSQLSMDSREELEEERRLFYVALTRAERRVTFSYAKNRYRYGSLINAEPSRFINEIDDSCLEAPPNHSRQRAQHQRKNKSSFNTPPFEQTKPKNKKSGTSVSEIAKKRKVTPYKKKFATTPSEQHQFQPDNTENLKNGMQVVHNRFGEGKVLQVEGHADNRIATIFFPDQGKKKIMLKYAKLKILD